MERIYYTRLYMIHNLHGAVRGKSLSRLTSLPIGMIRPVTPTFHPPQDQNYVASNATVIYFHQIPVSQTVMTSIKWSGW